MVWNIFLLFLIFYSKILIDIIVYIGFVLNKSNEDGNFKVFLKYSNLISNLAEKIVSFYKINNFFSILNLYILLITKPISLNNSTLN